MTFEDRLDLRYENGSRKSTLQFINLQFLTLLRRYHKNRLDDLKAFNALYDAEKQAVRAQQLTERESKLLAAMELRARRRAKYGVKK